ncbi:MAG: glycosyltransferase family 2 protein [Lachnospiraceae bacterium]|nr:glycosyltransferase family 2 protein [Lachnospiraceae bacterium]
MKNAVLLSTYNGKAYLAEMLESLLRQQEVTFTCYIHDDGSTDGTLEILAEYEKRYPEIFVILRDDKKNLGAKENFFHLISSVEADYYFFADQDDVWLPEKMKFTLEKLLDLEKKSSQKLPMAVFSDMYVTDSRLSVISDSFLNYIDRDGTYHSFSEILIDNPAAGCSIVLNRTCRDKGLELSDRSGIYMHDVWFLMTAAVFGMTDFCDQPLLYYRQHGGNEKGAVAENTTEKIKRNAADLSNRSAGEKKRIFYEEKASLARGILSLSGVPEQKRKTLEGFVRLHEMSFIQKIAFLKKNGIRRKKHNLFFMLWI